MSPVLRLIGLEIKYCSGTCASCFKTLPEMYIIKAKISNEEILQLKKNFGEKSVVIQGNEVALISCLNSLGRSLQLCEYWNILSKAKK